MAGWNPDQYLKFSDERTQPCRDLASHINLPQVRTAIDLGCGPGNSTQVLAERFPEAQITALDSNTTMINAAIQSNPRGRWITGDIAKWAAGKPPNEAAERSAEGVAAGLPESASTGTIENEQYDVVFSNAALQWLPDHATLFPQLFGHVSPGGALAIQIPSAFDRPAHRLLREMAASIGWRKWFPTGRVRNWHAHDHEFYYDLLAPLASRIDLWQTEYFHVLPNAAAIAEWYRGTGMRPYLTAIGEDADREKFVAEYTEKIRAAYRPRPDGRILFSFLRIFMIAYH
ncbi:MAG TPA: methyltransferase domain-containing protein [Candidatus Acidoferrales bacterium]|nr:methyltransferase domain-containing protein [Candidatus Acidoferrales bacterium]